MFEVGFFELVVIFAVALVVLGPTRLPGLVSKIGRWVGKARSMARQFREQLESEVQIEELNRMATGQPAKPTYPAPPPEFSGEPIPTSPGIDSGPTPEVPTDAAAAAVPESDSMIIPPDDPSHRDMSDPEPPAAEPTQGSLPLDAPHGRV